jgi:hypothetical protein
VRLKEFVHDVLLRIAEGVRPADGAKHGAPARLLFAATALWMPCACASADVPLDSQPSLQNIRALIGDAACDDDAQCRTIAVGTKACGGPEYYLAWSTKRTDPIALINAANGTVVPHGARHSQLRSNCMVVTDPGAFCAPGGAGGSRMCRLRNARQGPVD